MTVEHDGPDHGALFRDRHLHLHRPRGAPRWRIAKQLLTEATLLAVMGGALGLLFAVWGTSLLTTMLAAGPLGAGILDNSVSLDLRPDGRLIACTATLCLLTSLVFGLAPPGIRRRFR